MNTMGLINFGQYIILDRNIWSTKLAGMDNHKEESDV